MMKHLGFLLIVLVFLAVSSLPSLGWYFIEDAIPSGGLDLARNLSFILYAVVQLFRWGGAIGASFVFWAAIYDDHRL
jgi:hypothetical protein